MLLIQRDLGERRSLSETLEVLGTLCRNQGRFAEAETYLAESMQHARDVNDRLGFLNALDSMAALSLHRGDIHRARNEFKDCMQHSSDLGDKRHICFCLEGLAFTLDPAVDQHLAPRMLGAANSIRQQYGLPLPPSEQIDFEHRMAQIRQSLPQSDFDAAWHAGELQSLDEAVRLALAN